VPAGLHVMRMPEPAPGIRTACWQRPARIRKMRSSRSRSVIGPRRARARVTVVRRADWQVKEPSMVATDLGDLRVGKPSGYRPPLPMSE
jgi:hypothetical protein